MSQADQLLSCAGKKANKPCENEGRRLLRLRYFDLVGYFCNECAEALIHDDLAVQEDKANEKERRTA